MTLNITVMSKAGIHQCSDFRLSAFGRDSNGFAIPLEDSSPKVVTVQYLQWSGYLTYCGIGRWNDIPTHRYVADWIAACGPSASFEDLVSAIEREGTTWISGIETELKARKPHTFVFAAFVDEQPRLAVISNIDGVNGRLNGPMASGLIASIRKDASTHIYVTGIPSAVTKSERIFLKRLANQGAQPEVIRHHMARINREASARREAANGISASSMCYSLDQYGGGGGQVYGSVKGRFLPVSLFHGANLSDNPAIAQLLGSGAQMVGMTSGTSRGSAATANSRIDCAQTIEVRATTPPLTTRILSDLNERYLIVTDANDVQTLLVSVRNPGESIESSYVWPERGVPLVLSTPGYSQPSGSAINNNGDVAGVSLSTDRNWVATFWRPGTNGHPLGTLDGNNSTSKALNDAGMVIGNVSISPMPTAGEFQRAFIWSESSGMQYLPTPDGSKSTAIDINNAGEILYWVAEGGIQFSYVRHPSGHVRSIRAPNFHLYGGCLNDLGTVVGSAQDREGRRHSFLMDSTGRFELLTAPTGFQAVDIDNLGNVVGFDQQNPWPRAWLLTPQGHQAMLPAIENHSVDVRRIVNGSIYGHARQPSNWKHVHSLRWDIGAVG